MSFDILKAQLAQSERRRAVAEANAARQHQGVMVWQAYFALLMRRQGLTEVTMTNDEADAVMAEAGIKMKQIEVPAEGEVPAKVALKVVLVTRAEAEAVHAMQEAGKPILRIAR